MANDDEFGPVWPIPEEGLRMGDAAQTAYALADATLEINTCDTNGCGFSGDLFIDLAGYEPWFDDFVALKRVRLIDALDECLSWDVHDINAEILFENLPPNINTQKAAENYNKYLRLLVRLVRACREWEATDAKMTMEEMIANPLRAAEKR